jgi:hypothetical protein
LQSFAAAFRIRGVATIVFPEHCVNELYRLITPAPAERLSCWARHFPAYDEVVGYSALGHFFLRRSESGEYIVLHPFKGAAKSYGNFESIAAFAQDVLDDEGFGRYVLDAGHVAAIRDLLGPLAADEIYIPNPYPFLGGSERPETYAKGDAWVFIDIVGQMSGMAD